MNKAPGNNGSSHQAHHPPHERFLLPEHQTIPKENDSIYSIYREKRILSGLVVAKAYNATKM